jgi:threonine synthase
MNRPQPPAAYINPRTGATWPVTTALWSAPDDDGYVNLTPGHGLTAADINQSDQSLWRYRSAIRVPYMDRVSLGEGYTPLISSPLLPDNAYFKCDQLMPSGSFKDRGTTVMLSYLRGVGINHILEDSSGNAGSSIAGYAGHAGMKCRILVPEVAPIAKRTQIAATGAEVVTVPGPREAAATLARTMGREIFYAGHNLQAYFLEGTKTLAFELWEQLGFTVPDAVIAPIGQGSNIMGCHIGFEELRRAGVIDRVPRIFGVQAARCAPYYAAFHNDGIVPADFSPGPTIADGISSSKPVRLAEVLAGMRETGGNCCAADEAEIIAAMHRLHAAGLYVEPTCATVLVAYQQLLASGEIAKSDRAVLVLTGSGLKATDSIASTLANLSAA